MLFRHMSDLPLPPQGADTARRTRRRAPRVPPTLRAAVAATLERLEERIVMSTALEGDADVFLLEEPLVMKPVEPITVDPLVLDPLVMPPPEEPITPDPLTEPLVAEEPATSSASTTNLPPVAVDDYFEMDEDTVLVQSVLRNDYDPEGGPIRALDAAYPSFEAGTLEWDGDTGKFTFRPNFNFNGLVFFSYFLLDSGNKASNLATVKIKVNATNDAPTVEAIAGRSVGEGSAVSFFASASDVGVDAVAWDSDVPSESPGFIAEAMAIEGTSLTYGLAGAPAGAAIDAVTGEFSWAAADAGVHTFDVVVTDNGSPALSARQTITINVDNVAPTAAIAGAPASGVEGSAIAMTSAVTGASGGADTFTYEWTVTRNGTTVGSGASADFSFTPADNGTYSVTLIVTDDDLAASASHSVTVGVENAAPAAAITNFVLGAVHPLGTTLPLTGRISDAGTLDTHTASFLITSPDLSTPVSVPAVVHADGTVTASYSFDQPGVYQLWLTVVDDDGGMATVGTVGTSDAVIMIADAVGGSTEGKTIGGGWYYSAAGSYAPDALLTGRAYFSFVAQYEEGDSEPRGRTMFKLRNLLFRSNGYDSLDINGDRATIEGAGSINGGGSYGFRISVIDGSADGGDCDGDDASDGAVNPEDRIRVQIWDIRTGVFVYDTDMGDEDDATPTTELDGGSVHVWA